MFKKMRKLLAQGRSVREEPREQLALKGFPRATRTVYALEKLTDEELSELNGLLDWNCFTVDSQGRRFGDRAWPGKRDTPQEIPDKRIVLLNDQISLADKNVLEVGCLEGVHTIGLCQLAKRVVAVDARVENLVKSMVRCGFYGVSPLIYKHNLDTEPLDPQIFRCDVAFHAGVLYHLTDPVRHLKELTSLIRCGLLLDTHFALDQQATGSYEVDGRSYPYSHYQEAGTGAVFAGMADHAKWLTLDTLKTLLIEAGFALRVIEPRHERNGARVLIVGVRGQCEDEAKPVSPS